jgi:hypothetical protein
MGDAIERLIAEMFRTHGLNVTIQGGTYTMFDPLTGANQRGECDVIVETADTIVFVETKKKPHRRISQTGDALANLIDLSGSLFDAQAQLARHERILLHHGHIQLDNGKRLEHNGRAVERIAATLLDYGSLQDKYFLSQLFKVLAGASINAPGVDGATAQKLEKLNQRVSLLRTEIEQLTKLGQPAHRLFFNCWFFSLPQLVLLLDGIDEPAGFRGRLDKLRHFTFHTLELLQRFWFGEAGQAYLAVIKIGWPILASLLFAAAGMYWRYGPPQQKLPLSLHHRCRWQFCNCRNSRSEANRGCFPEQFSMLLS